MDVNSLRALVTVISFIAFVCIMIWVWRRRHTTDYEEASSLPLNEK